MELLEKSIRNLKGQRDSGRRRIPSLRYVRISHRPDGRHCARTRPHGRYDRLRHRNGKAARAGASGKPFRRRHRPAHRVDRAVEFLGYDGTTADAKVIALYVLADGDVKPVDILSQGQDGVVILDRTPFYAESGGQIGDIGTLKAGDAEFAVVDTTLSGRQHLHRGAMRRGRVARRLERRGKRRERASPPDGAQSLRHASAARGAAPRARTARSAEGLAGVA